MPICPNCETRGEELYGSCPDCEDAYRVEEDAYTTQRDDRWLGRQIQGRFIIASLLGRGSMSRVYEAYQPQIDRTVAIKLFDVSKIDSDAEEGFVDERDRFVREARVLANLSHPNCVVLYDFGYDDGGNYLYMAMEHVRGISLRRAVRRGLKFEALVEVVRQMLMALREAHAHEVVHRDLKPENVILSYRRTSDEQIVKVLDFGIAKLLGKGQSKKTQVGLLFGTPAYMSPEQCRGEVDVTPASDVYSIGCILFELIAGHLPFEADIPQDMVRQHQYEPVPPLVPRSGMDVPEGLEDYINKCLAKEPEDRFQHAGEALEYFERVVGGESKTTQLATGLATLRSDGSSKQVSVPEARVSGAEIDPTSDWQPPEDIELQSARESADKSPNEEGVPAVPEDNPGLAGVTDTVQESTVSERSSGDGGILPARGWLVVSALVSVAVFLTLLFATLQVVGS